MKRLLYIGHEAGRSGAPIVLLNLIKWIRQNEPATDIDLLLLTGGPLESEYRKYCDVHILDNQKPSLVDRIGNLLGLRNQPSLSPVFDRKYDVVIGNTIVTLPFLERFSKRDQKTVCWMHELDGVVRKIYDSTEFTRLANIPDHLIIPARAFVPMLDRFGVTTKTTLAHDFSNFDDVASILPVDKAANENIVVAGAGTIEFRKGTDLFIEIAKRVSTMNSYISFFWIGGESGDPDEASKFRQMIDDVSQHPRIKFLPPSPEYLNVIATADIFALTSREDPCPLVALDAAALGKPIVCFKDAGAIPDIIGDDAGKSVENGSIEDFADALIDYFNDRNALERAGIAAKYKVQHEFTIEHSCRTIYDTLVKVAGQEQTP